MKLLRSVFVIINYKTLSVTILALISTYVCKHYGIKANFPLTIIGIAIVFPVVFSIDSAYKRRERALGELSSFKAHMMSILYASRHWTKTGSDLASRIHRQLMILFSALKLHFLNSNGQKQENQERLFNEISNLSELVQDFRNHGVESGELSRINQYISKMILAIENLKVILEYRTPITLRAYSKIFIYSFPVLYGPYFAYTSEEYSVGLPYVMPMVFSFILMSLNNIQEHLENPFDQIGEDDIEFKIDELENKTDN